MPIQLIAGAVIAFVFILVCAKNLRAGVTLFCALLPAYLLRYRIPLAGAALPTTLLEVLFVILFLAWLFSKKDRIRRIAIQQEWSLPVMLLLVAGITGVAASPVSHAAVGLLRAYIIEPLIFFVVFATTIVSDRDRRRVIGAMAVTTALIGLTAIVQKISGAGIPAPWQEEATRRITSVFGFPNGVGLLLAPVTVLLVGRAIAEWRHGSRPEAAVYAGTAIVGFVSCLFAVSEGAMMGILAGVGVLCLLTKPLQKWAFAAALAGLIVVAAVPALRNYAVTITTLSDDGGSVRKIIWKETSAMLREHPVFGGGLAGYPKSIAPYHTARHIEIFQYPHNSVLNTWSELGILGMIAFAWLIILFFWRATELRRKPHHLWLANALIAAMIATLIHGLVDVPYFKNDLAFLWWIMFGLLASMMLEDDLRDVTVKEEEKPLPTLPRR